LSEGKDNKSKISSTEEKEMKKLTPVRSIRQKCLDCCAYQPLEVRLCPSINCPLFPYRMGKRPLQAESQEKSEIPSLKSAQNQFNGQSQAAQEATNG
jgi:hypothetical protein